MKVIQRTFGVTLALTLLVGCGRKKQDAVSPEVAASRAALAEIAQQPLLKSIGISQQNVVNSLRIDTQFKDTGEPQTLGLPTLVALNQNDAIEIRINGPKENLWSVGIRATLQSGRIDLGQKSDRLMAAFISSVDSVAWVWVTDQIRKSAERDFEVRKTQRVFGEREFTLWINPPDGTGPATYSILILPAPQSVTR